MYDQKDHWDSLHEKGALDHYSEDPSPFAYEVAELLPPHTKILELGCGMGNDSYYFSMLGHKVLAVDFSDVAIEKDREIYHSDNLTFETLYISEPLPFKNNGYDVVYARLSLHYFTDKKTHEIFAEIERVLKPDGLLCFVVKSTKDSLYGQGKKLEEEMYQHNGHVRHFFSEKYTKELLLDHFKIEKMESGEEKFYGDTSSFIKIIAKKK